MTPEKPFQEYIGKWLDYTGYTFQPILITDIRHEEWLPKNIYSIYTKYGTKEEKVLHLHEEIIDTFEEEYMVADTKEGCYVKPEIYVGKFIKYQEDSMAQVKKVQIITGLPENKECYSVYIDATDIPYEMRRHSWSNENGIYYVLDRRDLKEWEKNMDGVYYHFE